jgi:cytochrome P450
VGAAVFEEGFSEPDDAAYRASLAAIEGAVCTALGAGDNTRDSAPVLKATFGEQPVPAKWGKFGSSNIWAAQGNTIPATFWTVAYVLSDPTVHRRVVAEVDALFAEFPGAAEGQDLAACVERLQFLESCFKEALRLRGTGAEFRTVLQDHELASGGKTFLVKEGEVLYSSAYFMHHKEEIYEQAEAFVPTRWQTGTGTTPKLVSGTLPQYAFLPFGAGMHVCAGRFLARPEVVIFAALLLREFDCSLPDGFPGSAWRNAIGVVKPDRPINIAFKRRAKK